MNQNDIAFMRRAIELAQNGADDDQGGPFGCVIVRDGQIVGEGCNQVTSANDPTAHAEIVAIRAACKNLNSFQLTDCTVYTSCEPCPMCLGAIYWARPSAIYFAGTREDAAAAGFDDAILQPARQYDDARLFGIGLEQLAVCLRADVPCEGRGNK